MPPISRLPMTTRAGLRPFAALTHIARLAAWRPPALAAAGLLTALLARVHGLGSGRQALHLPSLAFPLRVRPAPPAAEAPDPFAWPVRSSTVGRIAPPAPAAGRPPLPETGAAGAPAPPDLGATLLARHALAWTSLLTDAPAAPASPLAADPLAVLMEAPAPAPTPEEAAAGAPWPILSRAPAAPPRPLPLVLARLATPPAPSSEPGLEPAPLSPTPATGAARQERPALVLARSLAAALPADEAPGAGRPDLTSGPAAPWPLLSGPAPTRPPILNAPPAVDRPATVPLAASQRTPMQPPAAAEPAPLALPPAPEMPLTPPVLPPAVPTTNLPAPLDPVAFVPTGGTTAGPSVAPLFTWEPSYRVPPSASPAAGDAGPPEGPSGGPSSGPVAPTPSGGWSMPLVSPTPPLTIRPRPGGQPRAMSGGAAAAALAPGRPPVLPLLLSARAGTPPADDRPLTAAPASAPPGSHEPAADPAAPAWAPPVVGQPGRRPAWSRPPLPLLLTEPVPATAPGRARPPSPLSAATAETVVTEEAGAAFARAARSGPADAAWDPVWAAAYPLVPARPTLISARPPALSLRTPPPATATPEAAGLTLHRRPATAAASGARDERPGATGPAGRSPGPMPALAMPTPAPTPSPVRTTPEMAPAGSLVASLDEAAALVPVVARALPLLTPLSAPSRLDEPRPLLGLPAGDRAPAATGPGPAAPWVMPVAPWRRPAPAAAVEAAAAWTPLLSTVAGSLPRIPGPRRPTAPDAALLSVVAGSLPRSFSRPGSTASSPTADADLLAPEPFAADAPPPLIRSAQPLVPRPAPAGAGRASDAGRVTRASAAQEPLTRPAATSVPAIAPLALPAVEHPPRSSRRPAPAAEAPPELPLSSPFAPLAAGAPPAVARSLALASRSSGAPLPLPVRAPFERLLNTSLAEVEVHTGEEAAAATTAVGAAAMTLGHRVFFAPGRFRPEEPEGSALLAHELTHVIQQRVAPLQMALKSLAGAGAGAEEAEAERTEAQVLAMHRGPFPAQPLTLARAVTDETPAPVSPMGPASPSGPALGTSASPALARITGIEHAGASEQNEQGHGPVGGVEPAQVEEVADRVYELIKERLVTERERRGHWL